MKIKLVIICIAMPLIISACSSTKETTGSSDQQTVKKDSLYVFDAVPENTEPKKQIDTVANNAGPTRMLMTYYAVQIGAFTTKERADEFASESSKKIKYKLNISFNPDVNLYVVQLEPEFTSHDEAERVRNELWQNNNFQDAWIATVEK